MSVTKKLGISVERFLEDGMRQGGVVEQRLALVITPGSQSELPFLVFQKNIGPFRSCQAQSRIDQRRPEFRPEPR